MILPPSLWVRSSARPWTLLGVVVAVMASSIASRLLEWASWKRSEAFVGSVPVLPTADAYAWLAGAKELGRLAGWTMSELLAVLSDFGGVEPEWIAFWLPVGIAWLPGAVIAWVCWQRGHPLAGLVGGVFATASLGYLARTRLGYADTDLFALLVPSAFAALWAWALERAGEQAGTSTQRFYPLIAPAVLIVLWAGFGQWLYPSGYPVMVAIQLAAIPIAVWVAGRSALGAVVSVVGCSLLALHFGVMGVVLGVGGVIWLFRSHRPSLKVGAAILSLAVIAAVLVDQAFLTQMMARIAAYSGWGVGPAPVGDWVLPQIDASIEETGVVGWTEWAQRVGTHWSFLLGGLAGYAVAVRRWPALLTFLPLLALGLGSFLLGHRFAMYAAPALGLGLGLGLAIVLEPLRSAQALKVAAPICLAAVVAAVIGWHARDLGPRPAVEPRWAGALLKLRDLEPAFGRVWAWWDEGYPAQFYGGIPTLADGGNASRLRTLALGRVFGARDPQRAAAFVRRAAAERLEAISVSDDWRRASYEVEPLATMTHRGARQVQRLLERPGGLEPRDVENLPDEFVVASWQTLRKAQWADLYGRWQLTGGENGYGRIATIRPPVQFDAERGLLETADGPVALRSMHILDASGSGYRNQWGRADGAHAIINNDAGEGVVMDGDLFQTLAVQLLVGDPSELAPHFELVVDAAPAARIYRVR